MDMFKKKGTGLDITALRLRVGKLVFIQDHPNAEGRIYFPVVTVGDETPLTIATGIAEHYKKEELEDKMVVVLTNIRSIPVYGIKTNGLILCAVDEENHVELLKPPENSDVGDPVEAFDFKPMNDPAPISDIMFEQIARDFWVDVNKMVIYNGKLLAVPQRGPVTTEKLSNCAVKAPTKY